MSIIGLLIKIYYGWLTTPTFPCVYTNMHIICSIEKHVSSITLKDVRVENVPGQAVRVWNTDPEKHNVIWMKQMSVKNVALKTKSKSALQLQLKSAYALIRKCFFNNVTAADSDVISVSFDSETTSRVSTAKVTQNYFLFCSKGGVIYVNNTGENNATLTVINNNLRHNSAHKSRSLMQFVNKTVAVEGNNSDKYMLEVGSDSESNRPSMRADENIFWFNVGLKHAVQYNVSVKATNQEIYSTTREIPTNCQPERWTMLRQLARILTSLTIGGAPDSVKTSKAGAERDVLFAISPPSSRHLSKSTLLLRYTFQVRFPLAFFISSALHVLVDYITSSTGATEQ